MDTGREREGGAPMISCRRRYWPSSMQEGTVKVTLPLFAIILSVAHVPSDSSPSWAILNHWRPVTSVWVAFGILALYSEPQPLGQGRRQNVDAQV